MMVGVVRDRRRRYWQGVVFTVALVLSLGLSSPTFAQPSNLAEFSQGQIDDVLDRLTAIRGTISSLTFEKGDGVTEDRRAELERIRSQILSHLDALLEKEKEGFDISGELAYFDRRSVTNGIAYFLSYEGNLKLLDDLFREDAYPHAGSGDQSSQHSTMFNRVHRALNERIYEALLGSLNDNELESWDQMAFATTVGHADNLRVYIDRRALDLEEIEQMAHWELSGIRDAVNQTGVLEDLYEVITNRDPVEPLALARMDLSDLSAFSAEYLGAVFRFALETIKHNQLFYAPVVPGERNPTFVFQAEPDVGELPKLQKSHIEPDNTNLLRQESHLDLPGEEKAPLAPTFKETYPSERIGELIDAVSAQGEGDYFTPYLMLLVNADSMVEDYAGEIAKVSQKGQHLAYALAQEGKMFSFVVTGVLAGVSFISGPLGMVANLLFLSTLAMDEVKIAFQEYDEGMAVEEILKTHAKSMALYGWMGATRLKVVKMALQKAPILHFGISAYFVKDLSTALLANHKQTKEINRAERMGQMGAMEASLARMDLLNSTLSTAALLGHNLRGAAAGLKQMTAQKAHPLKVESLEAQPIVMQNGFLPTSFGKGRSTQKPSKRVIAESEFHFIRDAVGNRAKTKAIEAFFQRLRKKHQRTDEDFESPDFKKVLEEMDLAYLDPVAKAHGVRQIPFSDRQAKAALVEYMKKKGVLLREAEIEKLFAPLLEARVLDQTFADLGSMDRYGYLDFIDRIAMLKVVGSREMSRIATDLEWLGFSEAKWVASELRAGRIEIRITPTVVKGMIEAGGAYIPGSYRALGKGVVLLDRATFEKSWEKALQTVVHEGIHFHDEVACVERGAQISQIDTEVHAYIATEKASDVQTFGIPRSIKAWEKKIQKEVREMFQGELPEPYADLSSSVDIWGGIVSGSEVFQATRNWAREIKQVKRQGRQPPDHLLPYVESY